MQNRLKNVFITFALTLSASVIFIAARLTLMFTNFDPNTLFYLSNTPAIITYLLLLIAALTVFILSKGSDTIKSYRNTFFKVSDILLAILFAIFVATSLAELNSPMPIVKITAVISLICALISIIFYFLNAFIKKNTTAIALLNVMRVLFLSSELIKAFTQVSASANSFYLFPKIISILFLAFFVLTEAKTNLPDASRFSVPMYAVSSVTFLFVSFSVIPDLVLWATGILDFEIYDLAFAMLKIIISIKAFMYMTASLLASRKAN